MVDYSKWIADSQGSVATTLVVLVCAVYNCPCDDLRLDIEGQVFEVQRIVFADTSECVEATRRGHRDAGI